MQEKDLSKLTTNQLKTKEKTLKSYTIIILVAVAIMLISGIFFIKKMGSPVFTILPIAFLPLVITLSKQSKNIKEEIQKRENSPN